MIINKVGLTWNEREGGREGGGGDMNTDKKTCSSHVPDVAGEMSGDH